MMDSERAEELLQLVVDRGTTFRLSLMALLVIGALLTWNQFRLASDQHRANVEQARWRSQVACYFVESARTPGDPTVPARCGFHP